MKIDSFKPHRRSIRLRGYDYSQAGAYFVTICTQNRECLFGEIVDGEINLNPLGEVILKWWDALPNYYPPVELDAFVVMPNHLHGIIVIADSDDRAGKPRSNNAAVGAMSRRPQTGRDDPAPTPTGKRTLGQLIGYFKFQSTKEINQVRDTAFARIFQRDYYERIIRNEREWNAIAKYIYDNPANWNADSDNPANFSKRPISKSADDYWRDAGL